MSRPSRPAQARSVATIERTLDAAVELLIAVGADRIRLSDVTERSGVSHGSIVHHFGSREGLITAAQAVQFARGIEERLGRSRALGTDDPGLVAGIRDLATRATSPQNDEQRRVRFQALASARHVPELRDVLIAASSGYAAEMARLVERGQQRGLVRDDVAPRAVAAYADTYASGRFVDELLDDERPIEEWRHLLTVLVGGVLTPELVDRVAQGAQSTAGGMRQVDAPGERPPIPTFSVADDVEERVLTIAAEHRARAGGNALRLHEVLRDAGVSRAWFARRFIDRETLLDLVCLRGLINVAHEETAAFEAVLDGAGSGEELLAGLAGLLAATSAASIQEVAWERLELLMGASTRPALRADAAVVVAASCGRVAAAVAGAQRRGHVRPDLSPTLIARFLWAAPLTFLVATLSAVPPEELVRMSSLTNATLIAPPSRTTPAS